MEREAANFGNFYWAYWRQRNEKAFTEISAGLTEAIDHAKGKPTKVVEHKFEPINAGSGLDK